MIFDSAIQSDTGNMLKLERLMLTNNAIQNNGRAFDLLLDAVADGKTLSSGTIDYLKVFLDKNPAYKCIWQEESSQRLSEALKLSASALTSSIPYIGAIKDSFETVYGSDIITGNDLSTTGKALNILGAGTLKKIKALFKLTEAIDVSIDFSKLSKAERLALSEVDNMLRLERAGVDIVAPKAWDNIAGLSGDVGKTVDKNANKSLSSKIKRDRIKILRNGGEVKVKTYEEARDLLDSMPELRPATGDKLMPNPDGRMSGGFADTKGTYRGDLINKKDPTLPVHPDVDNPYHANYPHYIIKLPNGDKAAIIIIGE